MVLAVLIALQFAVTGYTLHLADGAAEAGALAAAAGADPKAAVVSALPNWAAERVDVAVDGGQVEVALRPPAPHPGIAEALEVSADAWARSDDE
jgi:hypothetical protein